MVGKKHAGNIGCQSQHIENAKDVNAALLELFPDGPPPGRRRTNWMIRASEISNLKQ